eukprot:scaffold9178_cov176-Amphora_coffeaeformis.AAC.4
MNYQFSIRSPQRGAPKARFLLGLLCTSIFCSGARGLAVKSSGPSCAIIGGGISGLRCAQVLADKFDVTVFDTGRLRPGGRCASRLPGDREAEADERPLQTYQYLSQCTVDHAAQIITVPNGEIFHSFADQVKKWESTGVLAKFDSGSLFSVEEDKISGFRLNEFPKDQPAFFGTHGMGSIPLEMIKERSFKVVQDVWVSPSNGVRYQQKTGQWKVQAQGKTLGYFDKLVIAHNGKCADRLMSKSPAKSVHQLLRVNFAANVPKHGGNRMTLNSIYSLTFVLRRQDSPLLKALPESLEGAFIQNESNLRYLACQSRKHDPESLEDLEVWTLLSSAPFAKRYKAPQEFLPQEVVHNVTDLMLRSLEKSVSLPDQSLQPLESRLQLWGAAVPLNTWQNGRNFIFDEEYQVGVCGDWLCHPSIGGAWTSGEELALHLRGEKSPSVGLDGQFRRNEETHKSGIASISYDMNPSVAR